MNFLYNDSEILESLSFDANVIIVDETGSTNTDLKTLAESGATEWTILCAERQTNGRGRTGNTFHSPGNGIYMSMLLKPYFSPEDSLFITTIAGCSVCRAIEALTNKQVKIKWVNDIYTENGKVCGILTESSIDYNLNKINYAVLGIGLNIFEPENGFPIELKDKAASLLSENEFDWNFKNKLVAEIINQFYNIYNNFEKEKHILEYKERSFLVNKYIYYMENGIENCGKVIDIDEKCRLIIENQFGKTLKLSSGEVRINKW